MSEKMPGNGKKTVARSLDDLGEALRKNGFEPEKVVEAVHTAAEHPEATDDIPSPSQDVPAEHAESSPEVELAKKKDLLRARLAKITMDDAQREVLARRIDNTRMTGGIRVLAAELRKLEGVDDQADRRGRTEVVVQRAAQERIGQAKEHLLRRVDGLGFAEEKKAQLKDLIGQVSDEGSIAQISHDLGKQERKVRKARKAPADNTQTLPTSMQGAPKAPKAESGRSGSFSEVAKTVSALTDQEPQERAQDQNTEKLNLLHPDAFLQREQKEIREDFKRRITALKFKGKDQQEQKALINLLSNARSTEELDRFGAYLSDVENDRPANPDSQGITPGSEDTRTMRYEVHGDTMYVRQGKAAREATPEEVHAYHAARALPLVKVGDSYGVKEGNKTRFATKEEIDNFLAFQNLPPLKPRMEGLVEPGEKNDRFKEDFYEATGKTHEEFLRGLDARAKDRIQPKAGGGLDADRDQFGADHGKPQRVTIENKYRGKLSRGVRAPHQSHESIYHEKISNIDEILGNPRRQVMFGEFVAAQGNDGLIERYYEGQKDPSAWPISQNLILQKMLRAFDKRFAAVEALKAALTKGDAESFIRENTELGFMETGTNSDRAFEVLRDSLDHTLMVMPENEYEGVVDTLQKNQAIRNDYRFKALAERTRKTVNNEAISPEDLKWDTVEKSSFLRNAIRKPKFLDWAFGDESSKNSQEMLDAIKFNRKLAGTLLASTIANDPLLKQRLLQEIHTRDKAPDTAAQGIASYEGVLTEQERVATLDAMKPEVWKEKLNDPVFRKQLMPNYDTSSESLRANAFSDHLQKSGGDIYIRRGWLARLIIATFGTGVRKTVESLKAQGAFKN